MLRTIRALLASGMLLVSLAVLVTAGDKDEMMDNPLYTGWAKHLPGAKAILVEKTTFSDDKNPIPDEKVVTYTLLSVSEKRVVVQAVVIERELLGTVESAPTKHTYPAKLKKSYLAVAAPELALKTGEETIPNPATKSKGKDIKCKTLYGTYKKGGETVEVKAWINDRIPGGVVKRTRTTKEGDTTITTTVTLRAYRSGEAK